MARYTCSSVSLMKQVCELVPDTLYLLEPLWSSWLHYRGEGACNRERMCQYSIIQYGASVNFPSPGTLLCVCAKSLQSCLTLHDPIDCGQPGSSVHGILQARMLEQVAMPSSRGSSPPRNQTRISCISCIGRQVLYH